MICCLDIALGSSSANLVQRSCASLPCHRMYCFYRQSRGACAPGFSTANLFQFLEKELIAYVVEISFYSKPECFKNHFLPTLSVFLIISIIFCGDTLPNVNGCCSGMENATLSSTCDAANWLTLGFATQLTKLTVFLGQRLPSLPIGERGTQCGRQRNLHFTRRILVYFTF